MSFYADDPDAYVEFPVTDTSGGSVDWADPLVRAGETEIAAEWQGDPAPTRTIRVPLTGLTQGNHHLRLVVPGGPDQHMGTITLI